jgi:hypothetical protein
MSESECARGEWDWRILSRRPGRTIRVAWPDSKLGCQSQRTRRAHLNQESRRDERFLTGSVVVADQQPLARLPPGDIRLNGIELQQHERGLLVVRLWYEWWHSGLRNFLWFRAGTRQ